MPQRLTALLGHGLNESEAKVYLALLEQPRMSAGAIAKVTTVPRSHLYKVLDDLHAQGLVEILLSAGSRSYRAKPFEEFLQRRAQDLRERLGEVESQATTLGRVMRPPPVDGALSEAGEMRLLVGRRVVAREIDAILEDAKRDVVVAASDASADRIARHLGGHWPEWQKRGLMPQVTVILPPRARSSLDWRDVPAGGLIALRAFEFSRPALSLVVDEERALFVHPIPDNPDLRNGRDIALFSNDPAFVASHRSLLVGASRPVEWEDARRSPQTA